MQNKASKLIMASMLAIACASSVRIAMADEVVEYRTTSTTNGPVTQTQTVETRSVTVEPGAPLVPATVVPGTPVVVPATPATVTTTTTTTPAVVTTTPGTVQVVPLVVGDTSYVVQTIDVRSADLAKRLAALQPSATLTADQITVLNQDYARINNQIVVLKGQGTPSLSLALALAKDLDLFYVRLNTLAPSTIAYVPIIEGSHFTIFNGRIYQLDDLAVRRIGLESKITDRQFAGRISSSQANELRTDLSSIAAAEDLARADGDLSPKEVKDIYTAFDRVANRLDDYSGTR